MSFFIGLKQTAINYEVMLHHFKDIALELWEAVPPTQYPPAL